MTRQTFVTELPLLDYLPEPCYGACRGCAKSTAVIDDTMTPEGIFCLRCQVRSERALPVRRYLESRAAHLNDELQDVLRDLRQLGVSPRSP